MKFKIVADSCCDLDKQLKELKNIELVPLTLHIEGDDIVDDETFDQLEFIRKVSESKECAKSSCPSPGRYMEAYEGDYDCVFVVTLSGNLSGSYNSAEVGKKMYYEEHEGDTKKIHVFDSCSASIGEAQIVRKIDECVSLGMDFDKIVSTVNDYKLEMKTYFVIETLDSLRKNGRLTGIQAIVATVLNIKPVMSASDEGVIIKLDQARGTQKALTKMMSIITEATKNASSKVLSISHCNCLERAEWVKEEINKLIKFKDITITDMAGVSTLYANDGGIIIAV